MVSLTELPRLLPAIALALPQAAILSRVMRSALIETLGEDYIRTARAKGLSSSQTIWTCTSQCFNSSPYNNWASILFFTGRRNNY